jgi:hypothetical protein
MAANPPNTVQPSACVPAFHLPAPAALNCRRIIIRSIVALPDRDRSCLDTRLPLLHDDSAYCAFILLRLDIAYDARMIFAKGPPEAKAIVFVTS